MNQLVWKQDNEVCWLYDNGQHAATMSYSSKKACYIGSFYTSDGKVITTDPAGKTVDEAQKRIQDNYLLDRSYEWWMR